MQIISLGVERIHPGRFQPRDRAAITDESLADLAASIKKCGILNPLIGTPTGEKGKPIEVELVAGERRWRAAKLAGLTALPVQLIDGDDDSLFAASIVDNLQREDLTPIEEARALKQMQEKRGLSQRKLATVLGKSQPWVQQRLALLEVSPKVRELVNTRVFSLAHVRALAGMPEAVQEATAVHLGDQADKGLPMTSRKVMNLGQRVKSFLDPAKFEGAEATPMDAMMRNALIAMRFLLETQPEDILAKAVARLVQDESNGSLLGRTAFRSLYDVAPIVTLLADPDEWRGQYHRSEWWTKAIALGTGRVCLNCIFDGVAMPEARPADWPPVCGRWSKGWEETNVGCSQCILPTDAVDIALNPKWQFRKMGSTHVKSVDELVTRLAKAAAAEANASEIQAKSDAEKNRERIADFKRRCRQALNHGGITFDGDHVQAQWCARCAQGDLEGCVYADKAIGDSWHKRPEFRVLLLIDEGNVTRVVPRCEMFRCSETHLGEVLAPTAGFAFPGDRKERKTVIRWLRGLVESQDGNAIWSALRWLPYERAHKQHYYRDGLVHYILANWNDETVPVLLSAAESESAALHHGGLTFTLYNPSTHIDETWVEVEWNSYVDGESPWTWRDSKITWPFVKVQENK